MGHSIWDSLIGHTLRGCKTNVSYETSFKSHTSSLQNERFVRDVLQKSRVKSLKRAFRTRLPQKATRQISKTSVSYEISSKTHMSKSAKRAFRTKLPPKVKRNHPSEPTHHTALPSNFAIPAPPNHTRSVTPRTLTIPYPCHENRTFTPQKPHKVLRLPRKMTISSYVNFKKIYTTPHIWNDFDP